MTLVKLSLLTLLIVWALWMWSTLERRSLYYPDRTIAERPDAQGWAYEDVHVQAADGAKLNGWYLPGKKPLTLLICHGNAGNISHRMDKLMRLRQTGAGILLFDYRGYGLSEGRPSEKGLYKDAEAFVRYLQESKAIPVTQVVYYGESLGCAVAVEMALRHGGAGLILESPFTSTIAMGKLVFPWLPVQWMVHDRYDNLAKIPGVSVPLVVMHSPQDEVIPFIMGQQVYAAAAQPKQFFELTGGHNDGYMDTGDAYIKTVQKFLESLESRHAVK